MGLNGRLRSIMIRGMVIDMNDKQLATLAQLQTVLEGTTALDFAVAADERYEFIARTLQRFGYRRLPPAGSQARFLSISDAYPRKALAPCVAETSFHRHVPLP